MMPSSNHKTHSSHQTRRLIVLFSSCRISFLVSTLICFSDTVLHQYSSEGRIPGVFGVVGFAKESFEILSPDQSLSNCISWIRSRRQYWLLGQMKSHGHDWVSSIYLSDSIISFTYLSSVLQIHKISLHLFLSNGSPTRRF